MRPLYLDTLGLDNVLESYLSGIMEQVDFKIDFAVDIDKKRLTEDVAIVFYRKTQD